jgi:DNA-binding MarR family transcriptional regulator
VTTESPSVLPSIIECLVQIYYFFPRNRASRKKNAGLNEPSDAILWFLALKQANNEQSALSKKELMNFAFRWYGAPSTLQRHYEALAEAGLIERIDNEEDEREKVVWLTERGKQILDGLKRRRSSEIEILWNALGKLSVRDTNRLASFLKKAADAATDQIVSEIADDPFTKRIKGNPSRKSSKPTKADF